MNLKERIEIIDKIKNVSSSSEIEIKRDLDAVDIFVKNVAVEKIIKNAVNKDKNIILFCPSYLDKTLVASYIRSFLEESVSVEILSDISDNLPFVSAQKVIVPEPSVAEIIKIFELILCDYKTFIFAMNLKTFENALESLRTIIALNCPNLSSNNVEHLIGVSSAVLVYVDRTEDGLFKVSDIGKIVYKNNTAFFDVLYSSCEIKEEEAEEKLIEIEDPVVVKSDVIENDNQETPKNIETIDSAVEKTEGEKDVSSEATKNSEPKEEHKINKYKLLKEKIKSKKA